jgi:hypothetical protein
LVLDAFAPHKKSTKKDETEVGDLVDEFKKLNTTISVIPRGCTGYVQPLDVSINKIMKSIIQQCEEDHYDANPQEYNKGKYSPGDRRVLITHWVAKAWKILHEQHKDTIINTFRNLGLSLNPDGSEDSELKIRDLPGIEVGDYTLEEDAIVVDIGTPLPTDVDFQNPIALFAMELRSRPNVMTSTRRDLYYTAKEIKDAVPEIEDDESDATTDLEDESMDRFDIDLEGDFDPESEEEDLREMNMRD